MKLVWGTDKVTLADQDGIQIIPYLHFGLPFMGRVDFSNSARKKLAQSHLAGRHPAPVTQRSINLVRIGGEGGRD
eukprot:8101966-Prorocentrum_lima.AAC.1